MSPYSEMGLVLQNDIVKICQYGMFETRLCVRWDEANPSEIAAKKGYQVNKICQTQEVILFND